MESRGNSTEPVEPLDDTPGAQSGVKPGTHSKHSYTASTDQGIQDAHVASKPAVHAEPDRNPTAETADEVTASDVNTADLNVEPTQNNMEPTHNPSTTEPTAETADEVSIAELQAQIQKLEEERNVYINDLQRITAEFANFRKRTRKQHADITAQAAARLAESLLPILDAFEAAAAHRVEGIGSIQTQFLNVLNSAGLSAIDAMYQLFDPNKHEAVLTEPGDPGMPSQQQIVTAVLRTGYMWNNKVIRPVMVQVKG